MKFFVKNHEIKLYEFVKSFDLDPIDVNGNSFIFTIKIYKETDGTNNYFPKVYRREFFRISPSFSKIDDEMKECDEEILVEDMAAIWSKIKKNNVTDVLNEVLTEIKKMFEY